MSKIRFQINALDQKFPVGTKDAFRLNKVQTIMHHLRCDIIKRNLDNLLNCRKDPIEVNFKYYMGRRCDSYFKHMNVVLLDEVSEEIYSRGNSDRSVFGTLLTQSGIYE